MSSSTSLRRAGALGLAGGLIAGVGAAATFAATASDPSSDLIRGTISHDTFMLTEPIWALTHVLALVCFLGLWGSGLAGGSRTARAGLTATTVGLALLVPAELSLLLVPDQLDSATGPQIITGVFGVASVLVALGLLATGVAVLREGRWQGWGRYTPLVAGIAGLVLCALGPTDAFLLGIAIWKLTLAGLGAALLGVASDQPAIVARPVPATR